MTVLERQQMNKHPLLEQMRAARQMREDEITEPYRAELVAAGRAIESLSRRLRAIEEFLGKKIAQHVSEQMSFEVASAVRAKVCEAAASAPSGAKDFTVTLPREVMSFFDPRSLENKILRQYQAETLPRLSLNVREIAECTTIDITIPPLGYRQMVIN